MESIFLNNSYKLILSKNAFQIEAIKKKTQISSYHILSKIQQGMPSTFVQIKECWTNGPS